MGTTPSIRVAFLDDHLSCGGSTVNLIRLLPRLRTYGIDPVLITSDHDDGMVDEFTRAGIEVQYYPFGNRWSLYDDRVLAAYRRLAAFSPHVVVASHEATSFDMLRYVPPETFRLAEVQTDDAWSYALIRTYAGHLDAVEGVSSPLCRYIQEAVGGQPVKVVRIFNAVEVPSELPAQDRHAPLLRILYVGRLVTEQKRILRFIPIWQEIVRRDLPVHLTFVGDGPERARLVAELTGTDRQKVSFTGELKSGQVAEISRKHDVIALVSDYEGLCISVLEGMALGLVPVVTAKPGDLPEMIDNECGYAVMPDDPGAFVDVLEGLQPDSEDFGRRRRAAHEKIRDRFSLEGRVAAWAALIREGAPATAPHWPRRHPFLGPPDASNGRREWYYSSALRPLRRMVHIACVAGRGRKG